MIDRMQMLRAPRYSTQVGITDGNSPDEAAEGLGRMARAADWILVRHHHAPSRDELYNLKDDPGETRNLFRQANAAPVRDALQAKLAEWQRSIGDPLLNSSR